MARAHGRLRRSVDRGYAALHDFIHRSVLTWTLSFVVVYGGLFLAMSATGRMALSWMVVAGAVLVVVGRLVRLTRSRRDGHSRDRSGPGDRAG